MNDISRRKDYPVKMLAEGIWQINEFGAANCYLITGQKKALLIDTGCGYGDLYGFIRTLTDLPLLVAATHGHVDHIGGKGQFPEIYLHKADFGLEKLMSSRPARAYFYWSQKEIRRQGFSWKDAVFKKECTTRYIAMDQHTSFDLGGRTVRVMHTPGHSRGSCVFWLPEEGYLFTGDNVDRHLWLFLPGSTTVRTWLKGAVKIRKMAEKNKTYGGHDSDEQSPEDITEICRVGRKLLELGKTERKSLLKVMCYPEPKNKDEAFILYRKGRII